MALGIYNGILRRNKNNGGVPLFSKISAGSAHCAAIGVDGSLWVWGQNTSGQLGLGDSAHRYSPTRLGTDNNWKEISCGGNHTIAIKTNGTLWGWGHNQYANAGVPRNGGNTVIYTPTQTGTDTDWNKLPRKCGNGMSAAFKTNNTLYTYGINAYGELMGPLGTDGNVFAARTGSPPYTAIPLKVHRGIGYYTEICFGIRHAIALGIDGNVYVSGNNERGELGMTISGTAVNAPTLQQSTQTLTDSIDCGICTSYLRSPTGVQSVSFGYNAAGEKGDNTLNTSGTHSNIINGLNFTKIRTHSLYTTGTTTGQRSMAIDDAGQVFGWSYALKSDGTVAVSKTAINLNITDSWSEIAGGSSHTILLMPDGTLYSRGSSTVGAMGTGASVVAPITTPTRIN